jgi:Ca2+-transporting ATPase
VAHALNLADDDGLVLDGPALDALSDEALGRCAGRLAVCSRVSPAAKLRVVEALRGRGDVVAMLGDGVNDAAALRRADIGVAMGRRGTDVARAAADIVIADDRFETVAAAVEEGRVIFDNIRRFVVYLFSCNLGEVVALLGAALAGLPVPLVPLQILWLNLVTDTFPALALAVEPAEADVMRQPPRHPGTEILSRALVGPVLAGAVLIGGAALAAFAWGRLAHPAVPGAAGTLAFLTLAFAQFLHLGNVRGRASVLTPRRALSNPYALGALGLGVALQLACVAVAPLARVLSVVPPGAVDWLVVGTLSAVPAVAGQAFKLANERRAARAAA